MGYPSTIFPSLLNRYKLLSNERGSAAIPSLNITGAARSFAFIVSEVDQLSVVPARSSAESEESGTAMLPLKATGLGRSFSAVNTG